MPVFWWAFFLFLCGPVAVIGVGLIKEDRSIRDRHVIGLLVVYVAIVAVAWLSEVL
jgi:hypothetical protein